MLERGISEADVRLVCYQNVQNAYGKRGQMREEDWLNPKSIDQRQLYDGNSVLWGQAPTAI
jgi:uncharacterized protein